MKEAVARSLFDPPTFVIALASLVPPVIGSYWALLGFGVIPGGDSAGWGYALGIGILCFVSLICFVVMAAVNARSNGRVSRSVLCLGFVELGILIAPLLLIQFG